MVRYEPQGPFGSAQQFADWIMVAVEALETGGQKAVPCPPDDGLVHQQGGVPRAEHPLAWAMDRVRFGHQVLTVARDKLGQRRMDAWGLTRLRHQKQHSVARVLRLDQSNVCRAVEAVDEVVEILLDRRTRLRRV